MPTKLTGRDARIVRLKTDAGWLGRRRIAAALGLTERIVRTVLERHKITKQSPYDPIAVRVAVLKDKQRQSRARRVLTLKHQAGWLGHRRIASALSLPVKFVRSVLEQNQISRTRLVRPVRCGECGKRITIIPCLLCHPD